MKEKFRKAATRVSTWAGSATVFLLAVAVVVVWAVTGPLFNYSDTWQLVINTGTTIVTFLMVFLIQNTQNRDGKAVQLKLDELIRATKGARSQYVGLEDLSDEDLVTLEDGFKRIATNPDSRRAIEKMRIKLSAEHTRRHKIRQSAGVRKSHTHAKTAGHTTKAHDAKPAHKPHTTTAKKDTDDTKVVRGSDGRTYREVHGRMLPRHRTHPHTSKRILR